MAGYPIHSMAVCIKAAVDEVMAEHPEVTDIADFGLLVAEALTTSPSLFWVQGNIWEDIDSSVQN